MISKGNKYGVVLTIRGHIFVPQAIKRNSRNGVDFRPIMIMLTKLNKSVYEKDIVVLEEADSDYLFHFARTMWFFFNFLYKYVIIPVVLFILCLK